MRKLGGISQKYISTSKGGRYIDQLVDGVAHESKVGYTTLTTKIKQQIAKDAEITKYRLEGIENATWHFFKSPQTGKAGASKPLLQELDKNNILHNP